MATRTFFRTLVKERLTAAAEEIFQVFESAIAKYEEEVSSSKQEIERLRGLLMESISNQKTDISQLSTCKEETPPVPERCVREPHSFLRDLEPPPIKEEDHELWASEQHEEDQPSRHHSPIYWEKNNENDTNPMSHPQTHNSESEEQLEDLQVSKPVQFSQSLATTSRLQDGRENKGPSESLTNHVQTDLNQGSFLPSVATVFLCHVCDKSFSSNHHLVNHAFRFHSKSTDILCAVCGKTLERTDNLIVHLNSHKSSNCCHVCGKHYKSTTSLTEHMASHIGMKLHRCHVCGKECGRKGDLKIHMRIHTGEKPFCCSFCCKSFTHSGHLKKHMRSHTGERPHQCSVCGKGFLQSTHLKCHLRTHTRKY